MAKKHRLPIESGCADGFQHMHSIMLKNFGQWRTHTHPRTGVLCHISHSGDESRTVRVGTQRILGVFTLRTLCDIGDQYASRKSPKFVDLRLVLSRTRRFLDHVLAGEY